MSPFMCQQTSITCGSLPPQTSTFCLRHLLKSHSMEEYLQYNCFEIKTEKELNAMLKIYTEINILCHIVVYNSTNDNQKTFIENIYTKFLWNPCLRRNHICTYINIATYNDKCKMFECIKETLNKSTHPYRLINIGVAYTFQLVSVDLLKFLSTLRSVHILFDNRSFHRILFGTCYDESEFSKLCCSVKFDVIYNACTL